MYMKQWVVKHLSMTMNFTKKTVFGKFRTTCKTYYRPDPASYYTTLGLVWDAMLLKTEFQF